MKKEIRRAVSISSIVIVAWLLFGFVFAVSYKNPEFCTKKFCGCNEDEQIECNTCSQYNPVFLSVLLNVGKTCTGKEIIECRDGSQAGRRLELDKDNCRYIWTNAFTKTNRENDGIMIFENSSI